jgi:UDP-N-acetylglucosamine 2-epimerase (non-hydrolysing)
VRVGHVEAGLRTGDRRNPFPEEGNRVIVDHISDLCFAPTASARRALLAEGVHANAIRVTGNTVVDALLEAVELPWSPPSSGPLADLEAKRPLVLVTAHRRESFGEPLQRICEAIKQIALAMSGEVHIVLPVHPNPRVEGPVRRDLEAVPCVSLVPPVDYLTFVNLMKRCSLILTDSGGVQEEAPTLGVPVLVLRDVTERPDALESGTARLVGTDTRTIVDETLRLLTDPVARSAMARPSNVYGDGHAAERIVEALLSA